MRELRQSLARFYLSREWVMACALAGLCVRLAFALKTRGELRFYDEFDYSELGRALARGEGFLIHGRLTGFRPPGQPLLVAAVYSVTGAYPMMVHFAHALLLTTLPFAIAHVARSLDVDPRVPPLAVLLASFHPGITYASASLYPTATTAAALAGGIALLATRDDEGPSLGRAALGGLSLGVAGAFTTYFAAMPALAAVFLFRRARTAALLVALFGLLPAAAWVARNQAVFGATTLSTNGGFNLAAGANDEATPMSGNEVEVEDDPNAHGEIEEDRALSARAKGWIAEHPMRWAWLVVARGALVVDSVGAPKTAGDHRGLAATIVGLAMLPIVLLSLFGLWRMRRSLAAQLTGGALFIVMAASAATLVKPRFRFPVDPLLAVFAAVAIFAIVAWRERRRAQA